MMELSIIDVDSKIIEVRGTKVLLDSDVAALYGIQTKEINQAVRNNPNKFPDGYVFALDDEEQKSLRSKFLTLKNGRGEHAKYPPKVFTEKGLYMLATILKSPQATETTIAIVETFAKIRELSRTFREAAVAKTEEEKRPLMRRGGELIAEVMNDALSVSETETTLELNLALLNIKHTVKKTKGKKNA